MQSMQISRRHRDKSLRPHRAQGGQNSPLASFSQPISRASHGVLLCHAGDQSQEHGRLFVQCRLHCRFRPSKPRSTLDKPGIRPVHRASYTPPHYWLIWSSPFHEPHHAESLSMGVATPQAARFWLRAVPTSETIPNAGNPNSCGFDGYLVSIHLHTLSALTSDVELLQVVIWRPRGQERDRFSAGDTEPGFYICTAKQK